MNRPMIERVDGVVLAVRHMGAAADTYQALFGGKAGKPFSSKVLGAIVTPVSVGTNVIRVAQPSGPGPVADHLERWGEGLLSLVFATSDVGAVESRLRDRGVTPIVEDDALHIDEVHGLRIEIVPVTERQPMGALSFLYEVTHLVDDWKAAADTYVDLFGLDPARFSPISSDTYLYDGTLTLLDPPDRLDRAEVVTPYGDGAMNRFFTKRGQSAYMFFTECADMPTLGARLNAASARYAGDPNAEQPQSLFVHPSATHGVLIGVSPTNLAWVWSGRPELAKAAGDASNAM